LVEALAARQADAAQRLLQVLGLDVLVALDLEALDRRPFQHRDDQHGAVAPQFDVAKESGRVQRLHRLAEAPHVQRVADVHRQIVEDGAFGDALQAFDTNVADDEAVARMWRNCCFLRIGLGNDEAHAHACEDRDRRADGAHRTPDARAARSVATFSNYSRRVHSCCDFARAN
jgi:hypothetical protein